MGPQAGVAPDIVQPVAQLELLPVKSFPGCRPGVFRNPLLPFAALLHIGKGQGTLGAGDPVINLLGRLDDPRQGLEPQVQDPRRQPGQGSIPHQQLGFLQLFPVPALFQEPVPLLEHPVVFGQKVIVHRAGLGDLHIQEFPPEGRIPFHQLKVIGGKEHQVHQAVLFPGAYRVPVQEILFFGPAPDRIPFHQQPVGPVPVPVLEFCRPFFRSEAGQLFLMTGPEGKPPGGSIDPFQQVGFPLGVVPIKDGYIMCKRKGHLAVVPEMEQPQVFQAHQETERRWFPGSPGPCRSS